jgi:hypothetical protein
MLASLLGNLAIYVANGDDVAPWQGTVRDHCALVAHSNGSDPEAIVFRPRLVFLV